jgi:hypothetical protein
MLLHARKGTVRAEGIGATPTPTNTGTTTTPTQQHGPAQQQHRHTQHDDACSQHINISHNSNDDTTQWPVVARQTHDIRQQTHHFAYALPIPMQVVFQTHQQHPICPSVHRVMVMYNDDAAPSSAQLIATTHYPLPTTHYFKHVVPGVKPVVPGVHMSHSICHLSSVHRQSASVRRVSGRHGNTFIPIVDVRCGLASCQRPT